MDKSKLLVPLFVLLVSACGLVQDSGHAHTGCSAWHNSDWSAAVLTALEHSDDRSCPLGLQPGQQATSGGKVYDLTVPEYTIGSANWLTIEPHQSVFGSQNTCSSSLGSAQTAGFYLGQSQPPQGLRWQAETYVSWQVQNSPEYACFWITVSNPNLSPRAVITIPYNGSQF